MTVAEAVLSDMANARMLAARVHIPLSALGKFKSGAGFFLIMGPVWCLPTPGGGAPKMAHIM